MPLNRGLSLFWSLLRNILFLFVLSARCEAAALPQLSNLTPPQAESVFRTLAATLAFRPVEPASAFGDYFGFAFGLVAIGTNSADLKAVLPDDRISFIPNAYLFGAVQLPFGFAAEVGYLPRYKINQVNYRNLGVNAKWTVTSVLPNPAPIDVAIRLMHSSPRVEYAQTLSAGKLDANYNSTIRGANISVSVPLLVFEPYLGYGLIESRATLAGSGDVSLYDRRFAATNTQKNESSSKWFYGGFQLRFIALTFSAQYDRMFSNDSYSLKFGFKL